MNVPPISETAKAGRELADAIVNPEFYHLNNFSAHALAITLPLRPLIINGSVLLGIAYLIGLNLGTALEITLLVLCSAICLAAFWSPAPAGVAILWTHDNAKGFAVIFGIFSSAALTWLCSTNEIIGPSYIPALICFVLLSLTIPYIVIELFRLPIIGKSAKLIVHILFLLIWAAIMSIIASRANSLPSVQTFSIEIIQSLNNFLQPMALLIN